MLQALVLILVLISSLMLVFSLLWKMRGTAVFLKEENIYSSALNLQRKMLSSSSSALSFVYFHIVRTGLIYFLHFLLSLLTLGLSHLLLRQAWEGRTYHCI